MDSLILKLLRESDHPFYTPKNSILIHLSISEQANFFGAANITLRAKRFNFAENSHHDFHHRGKEFKPI